MKRIIMGSYEEFKTLAKAAFAKMIVKPREQEVPDSEAPEFTQLVDFLDKSDQRNEFLQKLVKVSTKRFSRERVPDTEFLVTCSGDAEVFSVGYGGFWLLSLLEAGKDDPTTTLQSFKIGRLGPIVYMGVWGDQEIAGRWIYKFDATLKMFYGGFRPTSVANSSLWLNSGSKR